LEQAEFIRAYSFNAPDRSDLPAAVERVRRFFPNDWSLAAFDGGEMTAWLRIIPMAMRINGHGLSFGVIGPVVSLPQHRRKGYVGALLRQALSDMRERGQVISGLHTPHPALYRRYGWEIASERRVYTFAPKDIVLQAEPSERGRTRLLSRDDWSQADRVYRMHAARRNGALHRGEVWWRESIFGPSQPESGGGTSGDVALWEDGVGEPQGYVVYYQRRGYDEFMPPFYVRELVALTQDAYLNLLLYITRHDLPQQITFAAAPDDPFCSLVSETQRIKIEHEYDVMLRICDVEAALRVRALAYPQHNLSLTLALTDGAAPWNEGTYRIEVADGRTSVERASGTADLSLSTTTLAPVFNGYLSVRSAAIAGLAHVHNETAVGAAESFFAALYPPFCADGF
jgi:predicted acetyltransferase